MLLLQKPAMTLLGESASGHTSPTNLARSPSVIDYQIGIFCTPYEMTLE